MRHVLRPIIAGLLVLLPLAGCNEDGPAGMPAPVAMTDEALGHYCQMYLADHGGPKAQIHLKGFEAPLWFSQVSDAVAFVHDGEKPADIVAVFVSDMGKAPSWGEPGVDNWINADKAYFVIGSKQMGGMGTPEAIPFGTQDAAQTFTNVNGGKVVSFAEIPEQYVRPPLDAQSFNISGLRHFPMRWTHLVEKELAQIQILEHVSPKSIPALAKHALAMPHYDEVIE